VEQVFRWAHAADPGALLFYNDAEGETLNAKSDAIYAMVKDFKRRGVPIDGVGLQMHLFDVHPDIASIAANIARFTSLGVQVHITEMDVSLPTAPNGEALQADLERQSEIYGSIARACLSPSRLHRDSDLGLHRQVLVDSFEDEGHKRRRPALRP
jgi:endo-1,4-beta-xylanase